jgi:hypothetical protein
MSSAVFEPKRRFRLTMLKVKLLLAFFPLLMAAQVSPGAGTPALPAGVVPNSATGGGSCITLSNVESTKTNPGNREIKSIRHPLTLTQHVYWQVDLDSTTCKGLPLLGVKRLPLVVRLTVHFYLDQAKTTEVPLPPEAGATNEFLIERLEKITLGGSIEVPIQTLKETKWTGITGLVVVATKGQNAIEALQEAQVSDYHFCQYYPFEKFTGKTIKGVQDWVPTTSFQACAEARAKVMAERFLNEHSEMQGVTGVTLCADENCVQSHQDNTVPTKTNISTYLDSRMIDGKMQVRNVHQATRTFENVVAACEKCYGHWTVTGVMNVSTVISGAGHGDYTEVSRYTFACKAALTPPDTRLSPYDKLPIGSVVPKGQSVVGKHSPNDSVVTCSTQRTQ